MSIRGSLKGARGATERGTVEHRHAPQLNDPGEFEWK